MIERNNKIKSIKKDRIKISSIKDFNKMLQKEDYNVGLLSEIEFKKEIINEFNINNKIYEEIYKILDKGNITYKVRGVKEFIDYIECEIIFEDEHNRLCRKISEVKTLIIDRVEYERILTTQDDVEDILKAALKNMAFM